MNEQFERVKGALDLKGVILSETGLKMKGKHLEHCPFCEGHECFSIQADFFKCFQCDAAGDVFTFLERRRGIDTGEALQVAAKMAFIELEPKGNGKKTACGARNTQERIFEEAANYYHGHMLVNGGREYLQSKRGHAEGVLSAMRVGWTDGKLHEHLTSKGFGMDDLLDSGLVKEKDGQRRDFFAPGLAIFPHTDTEAVIHFTMKDPAKKLAYQLPSEKRGKGWTFYNQTALLKYKEIILVEGENDLLSVMDAGVKHVIACIGQLSEEQIKELGRRCKGLHLYLWFDKDDAGRKYVRKVMEKLQGEEYNIHVIDHPGDNKDPDEYIQKLKPEQRRKAIKDLQEQALDPLAWEIAQIAESGDLGVKIKLLDERKIFHQVARRSEIEKLVYVEKLEKLGLTKKAIEQRMEKSDDLKQIMMDYFGRIDNPKNADPKTLTALVFKFFNEHGRFFRDSQGVVYLLYNNEILTVGNNRQFNALMLRATTLDPSSKGGGVVWERLASEGYNSGIEIDITSWIATDRKQNAIFVNFNLKNNKIIKITPQGIEEIANGMNTDSVLLKSSLKIKPVHFHPDASIKDGFEAIHNLVFRNLTCEVEQRYLILAWLVSAFLLDYSPSRALMKFSGASSSGKTTAARLLSTLIYGTEQLGDPTAAAAYSIAAQNPMVIIDNLEQGDVTKSIEKFLLLAATGGGKEKRSGGSDTGTIQESPKSLILITAIEPFTKAEHINRIYDLAFSSEFKKDDFIEDEVLRDLEKKRDTILSAMMLFIQKHIMPNLERRREYLTVLKKQFRNHSKNRTDEYLSMLMLILEEMLPFVPMIEEDAALNKAKAPEIWERWIRYQDGQARETETSSNTILKLMDGLVREYLLKMKTMKYAEPDFVSEHVGEVKAYTHESFHLEMVLTKPEYKEVDGDMYNVSTIEFVATSAELAGAFDAYCKFTGTRNPYSTASVLSARLRNDRKLLPKGNWEVIETQDKEPYFKIVGGERYFKFRKTLIR